jgi:hypothetical protein
MADRCNCPDHPPDPTAPLPDEELAAIEARVRALRTAPNRQGSPVDAFMDGVEEATAILLPALRAERAAPLDVERLAAAMDAVLPDAVNDHQPGNRVRARAVAAEYVALAPATGEGAET